MGASLEFSCGCGERHLFFLPGASMADHLHYRYEFACPKNGKTVQLAESADAWWKSEQGRPAGSVVVKQLKK